MRHMTSLIPSRRSRHRENNLKNTSENITFSMVCVLSVNANDREHHHQTLKSTEVNAAIVALFKEITLIARYY